MHMRVNGKMKQPAIIAFMEAALREIKSKRVRRQEREASQSVAPLIKPHTAEVA